jgi:regulatory protein
MTPSAYVDALRMLGRRELSEAQVRQRLLRHGHSPEDIDAAVARLREERALDDARVAEAIARTESSIRLRGKLRIRRQIEHAGVAGRVAREAVDAVFDAIDDNALLEAALAKRLRGRAQVTDDALFRRLYR